MSKYVICDVLYIQVKRFTMKDIQGLEERIDNLEYYTSLSLLESDTKSLFIANSTGADRFKNGSLCPDNTVNIPKIANQTNKQFNIIEAPLFFDIYKY